MYICEKYDIPLEYVGDGKLFIGHYNPDFVNMDCKVIVEIQGDFWHMKPYIIRKDAERFRFFRKNGYKCIAIWASELPYEDLVLIKLSNVIELPAALNRWKKRAGF